MTTFAASRAEGRRKSVTLVVSHIVPTYGLETVALNLIGLLADKFDVKTVCIGGGADDLVVIPEATLLGAPLRGVKRLLSMWRLWKYARRDSSDYIILAGVWIAIPWLLVCGRKAQRSIVWEHTLLESKLASSCKLRLLATAARYLYPRAKSVVAVSGIVQRDLLSIAPRAKVVTIHNPFKRNSLETKRPDRTNAALSIVTVGSLTPIKSQELVIRAVPMMPDGTTLSLIGSGFERGRLEKLAIELDVSESVVFEGFLKPDEVRKRLHAAHLLVHCSVAETFGLVYIEAADAGLPVVSTRSDIAEYMIPKYVPGRICDRTPEDIAEAIERELAGPVDHESRRSAAAYREAAFSPATIREQWIELMEGPANALRGARGLDRRNP